MLKIYKMIKKNLKLLLKFCLRFGVPNGINLFVKLKTGNTKNIKIRGIKYPFSLRNGTSDIPTFYQVFLHKEYDIHFENPRFIIDGGANIGLFAILMKNRYPDTKIICLEPDPENFDMLKKNVSVYDGIYCEHCGVWNKDTKLIAYDKYNYGKWGIVVEENVDGKISAVSIDTLLGKYTMQHIDVLKLDIETSEKRLFSENFLTWLPKVKTLIIELHDWVEEGCSKPFFEAINKSFSKYKFSMKGENVIIDNINFTEDK
jgi:FkbM family methyltransferase